MIRFLLTFTVAGLLPALGAPAFEFKDGDRVAFLGDTFIEREQYESWIELAATTAFPDRNVTFRNLGWSADTPAGASRSGLSLMQAGMEPPDEGWKQLEQQLETYKPNVIFTGYGMASSLPGGQTAEQFKKDFERLLDRAAKLEGGVRVVVLGAPPRLPRDGESDALTKAHEESLAAINKVQRQVAEQRKLPFVALDSLAGLDPSKAISDNEIHLNSMGYQVAALEIGEQLGWKPKNNKNEAAEALRRAIIRKNEWFFHRSRPANMAYIFGFRKAEQGRNAGEIEAFDRLVAEEDARIAKMRDLSKGVILPEPAPRTKSNVAANTPQPHPEFTVADGYEVTLWAENPLMHKPTQMNFDERGRLWVASSETYPQVEVGQTPDDKIIVLEDTDNDGKADASKVFAEGMLMPTAVLPGDGGCYVGQSTDLLHFTDTNGDGKADTKRRVLSGFGTEDTHHNLHTLRRGPDGKLWMNQSIYTRTDTETPNGLMRLKSGGIMRYDPRTERIETVFYGWCNPWGHQFDKYGQSFVTDGAGSGGINWAVPGAMYFTYANAPKVLESISPGGYPKFCGLEIIESPVFPADWQGSLITCDFRAHRIVRFSVAEQGSGYAAQEAGDLLRTDDVNFRPIDVKIGPDGALYIADWSNPIINHGEVDFRDPRRDREHGRIWRVSKKGAPLTPRRDLAAMKDAELLELLVSDHRHEREAAMTVLIERKPSAERDREIARWISVAAVPNGRKGLAALWLSQGLGRRADWGETGQLSQVLADEDGRIRAGAIRVLGTQSEQFGAGRNLASLVKAATDPHPRVRLEAVRVLGKLPGPEAMDAAFRVLGQPMDRFLEYALWLNVRDHGDEWLAALLDGRLPLEGREAALEFALSNLPPAKGIEGIRKLMPKPLPRDASGPWLGLAAKTADPAMLGAIHAQALDGEFEGTAMGGVLRALETVVAQRQVKLPGDSTRLGGLFQSAPETAAAALRLAGALRVESLLEQMTAIANAAQTTLPVRLAAVEGLSQIPSSASRDALLTVAGSEAPAELKRGAALALARHHRAAAIGAIRAVIPSLDDLTQARAFWQQALSQSGLSGELAKSFLAQPLAAKVAALNLPAVPDIDEHAALLDVLRKQAGTAHAPGPTAESIQQLAKLAAEKGNAARGEAIYRQPGLACVACHAIGGAGGKVGPDMTSIGASAPLDYLVESILMPGAKVKEGYHSVVIDTKDGRTLMGRLLKSGGGSVVLADASGQEFTLADEAILKRTDSGSLMPANLIAGLKEQEQFDLFKFLSQLGRPGDYDATNSRAPRVWAVLPIRGELPEAAMKGDPAQPWIPINGTVNGTLLASDVDVFASGAVEILVGSRLELSEAAEVELSFPQQPLAIWVNGQPQKGARVRLEAGIHKIVVRHKAGTDLRFECSTGTFLPSW